METLQEEFKRKGLICAMWCIDSETADECLVDVYNHVTIAKRIKGKIVDPSEGTKCL